MLMTNSIAEERAWRARRHGRAIAANALVFAMVVISGCAQPSGPVFEPLGQSIVWPQPPDEPRIRYVGSLSAEEDLKAGQSLVEHLGGLIFGERAKQAMATPYAVTSDGERRVYVSDSTAGIVHVFDLNSRRYDQWRPAPDRRFGLPLGLAWDPNGGLFVADAADGVIYRFNERGALEGTLGGRQLSRPCGLAYDAQRDRLYIADSALHQVIVLDRSGRFVDRLGERGAHDGQFNYPTNVALDGEGRLFVSDSLNFRVQVFDAGMNFIRRIGLRGNMPGHFSQPKGLAVSRHGHLYVVDAHFEAVQIFDNRGRLLLSFGREGAGPGEFWLPAGIHVDQNDCIWVADTYNRRTQVFEYLKGLEP